MHSPLVQYFAKREVASFVAAAQQESKPLGSAHLSDVIARDVEILHDNRRKGKNFPNIFVNLNSVDMY